MDEDEGESGGERARGFTASCSLELRPTLRLRRVGYDENGSEGIGSLGALPSETVGKSTKAGSGGRAIREEREPFPKSTEVRFSPAIDRPV